MRRCAAALPAAAAALLIGACAPKARYTPPPADPVAAFKESENWKAPQPRDADARGPWWDVFIKVGGA